MSEMNQKAAAYAIATLRSQNLELCASLEHWVDAARRAAAELRMIAKFVQEPPIPPGTASDLRRIADYLTGLLGGDSDD